jgi:hypothetical protein
MPKIYDNPQVVREPRWEHQVRRPAGNGPAGPSAQTDNRVNLALIVIALALMFAMVLFKGGG